MADPELEEAVEKLADVILAANQQASGTMSWSAARLRAEDYFFRFARSGHVLVLSEDRVVVELTPDQAEVLADPERQRLSASLADQFATVAGRSAIRAALSRKQEAS